MAGSNSPAPDSHDEPPPHQGDRGVEPDHREPRQHRDVHGGIADRGAGRKRRIRATAWVSGSACTACWAASGSEETG